MLSTGAITNTAAVMIEQDEPKIALLGATSQQQQHYRHPGDVRSLFAAPVAPLPRPPSHANSPIPYDSAMYNEEDLVKYSWSFADLGLEMPKEDDEDDDDDDAEEGVPAAAASVNITPRPKGFPVTPTHSNTSNSSSTQSSTDSNNSNQKLAQPAPALQQNNNKCNNMNSLRRAGKKKPPGAPKRPLSAYNIFFKNERPKVLREMLGAVSFEQLGKLIGERWRALNHEQRRIYEHHAHKDVLRYRKQMDHFEDARRQRFRHPHNNHPLVCPGQHQPVHPPVVSYDMNMDNGSEDNNAFPCVSFEEANHVQSSALGDLQQQPQQQAPLRPPIIHNAPPPMYQLPLPATARDRVDCQSPCSPEPVRPYQTISLSTAAHSSKNVPSSPSITVPPPPVTPPTPRPVVLQQIPRPQAFHRHHKGENPINVDDDEDDSPACHSYYHQNYSYSRSASSQYQYPPRHDPSQRENRHPVEEQQLILPKPPGRCLGGPPEHIAIPQGMEVYLPTTRSVFISSPSSPTTSSSSASTATSSDHGEHDDSMNTYQRQQQEHQQQVIVTGRRKYKVYYSAYRMKRSEADDYLKRLSDTLASWNTSVSATMASPTDSFVLNDDRETHPHDSVESTAAAAGSPRAPSTPPVVSHGGAGAGGPYLPYYHHRPPCHGDDNHDRYREMHHDPRYS